MTKRQLVMLFDDQNGSLCCSVVIMTPLWHLKQRFFLLLFIKCHITPYCLWDTHLECLHDVVLVCSQLYPFLCSVCNWPFVVLRRCLNAVSGLWLFWLSSKGSVIQCTPLHTQLKQSNADISWGIFRYLFIWRGWPRSCTALLFFSINSVLSCNLCAS